VFAAGLYILFDIVMIISIGIVASISYHIVSFGRYCCCGATAYLRMFAARCRRTMCVMRATTRFRRKRFQWLQTTAEGIKKAARVGGLKVEGGAAALDGSWAGARSAPGW
jgi:hypothetical protein